METLPITLEFAGGAELLFDKIKKRQIQLYKRSMFICPTIAVPNSTGFIALKCFITSSSVQQGYFLNEIQQHSHDKPIYSEISLPSLSLWLKASTNQQWTINHLLKWMEQNLLRERPELFLQQNSVRPGILVLVNQEDWELCGGGDYKIQPNDSILFISTLHGG